MCTLLEPVVLLAPVVLHLVLGVEGLGAHVAGGGLPGGLDPLVRPQDVLPDLLLRGQPLPAPVAKVVQGRLGVVLCCPIGPEILHFPLVKASLNNLSYGLQPATLI